MFRAVQLGLERTTEQVLGLRKAVGSCIDSRKTSHDQRVGEIGLAQPIFGPLIIPLPEVQPPKSGFGSVLIGRSRQLVRAPKMAIRLFEVTETHISVTYGEPQAPFFSRRIP